MAYIAGLKESEQALVEIKKILKELEGINAFLEKDNPSALYKLSFTVKDTEAYDAAQAEKPSKKSRGTQYTAPLICDDKEALNHFVQNYMDSRARTIKNLVDTHRICLSEEELDILGLPAE